MSYILHGYILILSIVITTFNIIIDNNQVNQTNDPRNMVEAMNLL